MLESDQTLFLGCSKITADGDCSVTGHRGADCGGKGFRAENGLEWVSLTQMTNISITVGRNPLEEME